MNVAGFFTILIGLLLPLAIVGVIIYFMVRNKNVETNVDEYEYVVDNQQIKNTNEEKNEPIISENVKHMAFPSINDKPAYKNANHKSKKAKNIKSNDEDFYNYKKYVAKWDSHDYFQY